MDRRRRLAVVLAGSGAAIAGSVNLLASHTSGNFLSAIAGFAAGLCVTMSVGVLVKRRLQK